MEISPEYSFEELMLKLKLQYFSQLLQRADTLEKTLMLGKSGLPFLSPGDLPDPGIEPGSPALQADA